MRRLVALSLIALASGPALGEPAHTTVLEAVSTAGEIDATTQTEDVRFKTDDADRMTVPVRLGGSATYRFLVDTGADRTAISRELAVQLKLRRGAPATLHSVAGITSVSTATVPSLQLTRKAVRIVDAPLLERVHMGADGILGVDSLRSQRILFDFEAQTMSIVPSVTPDFVREPGSIVVTASRRNGRLVLTQATANGRRVNVVLDTGSEVTIGNEALRQALLRSRQLTDSHRVEVHSVTGHKIHGDYTFIRRLEIGGVQLKDLAIIFADAHTFKKLGLRDKPALLLGMNAMRAFRKVSIDFANRKLRVVLPEHSAAETELASLPLGARPSIGRVGRRN